MPEMSVAKPTQNQSFETLDVQVKGLETDVRDLKDSVVGLNAKFDQAIASISHEVRSAISGLTNQFTERQRTPWAILIPGAGFIVVVLGLFGSQAISPIVADIKSLKDNAFPREEAVFRYGINNQRLTSVEGDIRQIQGRRYEELVKEIDRLRAEIRGKQQP